MQIIRNSLDSGAGPSDWFTGDVYIDTITTPSEDWRIGAAAVHFTPGARTVWHAHPNGQTIWVTEGIGLCQHEGGPIEAILPGDRVFFEPGENHWHGAAPPRFMTHIAMQQADEHGNVVTWGDHVTDVEYASAPPSTTDAASTFPRTPPHHGSAPHWPTGWSRSIGTERKSTLYAPHPTQPLLTLLAKHGRASKAGPNSPNGCSKITPPRSPHEWR